MQHPTGARGAYWALAFICLVWGTTYLVLRIGVLAFPPFLFTSVRQLIAGSLLTAFMLLVRREALGSWANIGRQALAGFLMICLGNGLVGWAEVYVPSGIASLLCSLMPVWVILINTTALKHEAPNKLIISGVLLGMAGMLLVFRDNLADFSNPNYTIGIVLIMVAVVSWAGGSILVKNQPKESHPILNAGLHMLFGGAAAFVFSLVFDDWSTAQWSPTVAYSLLYLVLIGSIAAYAAFSYALSKLPTAVVSLYAYVNPLVALILGWFVLSEELNTAIGIAFVLTVSGIYLVNKGYQRQGQGAEKPAISGIKPKKIPVVEQ